MTTRAIIAVATLLVLIALKIRSIHGHRRHSGNDHENGWWRA